jgi:hypothetical protein
MSSLEGLKAKSCGAPVPQGLALLGGSDSICNDAGKRASHVWAITSKRLVNLELPYNPL